MAASEEHIWVRRHLPAAAAGLLESPDDERLQTHLESCTDCARKWQEQIDILNGVRGETDPEGERHIPAAMIARWDQATRALRGVERQSVQAHLERCGTCREELETLGLQPELTTASRAGKIRRPGRDFGNGLAWGVGATALAAVMAWWLILPTPPRENSGVLPWVAPVTLRGGIPQTLELPAASTSFSLLATVPLELNRGRPAWLRVIDPREKIILETQVASEQLEARTLSMVIRVGKDVPLGSYRVVFSQAGTEGQPRTWESTFLIKRPGS